MEQPCQNSKQVNEEKEQALDSLQQWLAGQVFTVITRGNTSDGQTEYEAWAYDGPLDFESALPVTFGIGDDPSDALDALDLQLQKREADRVESAKTRYPLVITNAHDDQCQHESERAYPPLIGKACRIAAVGMVERVLAGEERVLVVFEDESIEYTNHKPFGSFFVWQLAAREGNDTSPEQCVRALAQGPLRLEPLIDPMMTSRGGLVVTGYLCGNRTTMMPDTVLGAIRRHITQLILAGRLHVGH